MTEEPRHLARQFFQLTFLCSWGAWLPAGLVSAGLLDANGPLGVVAEAGQWLGGLAPSVVAVVLVVRQDGGRGVRTLLGRAFRLRLGVWYLPVFLLLPVGVVLAHSLNGLLGGEWPRTAILSSPWLIPVLFGVFLLMQVSEEFGWRGFALDHLQHRWTAPAASLIVGGAWAVWHVPMFLIDGFGLAGSGVPFAQFAVTLVTVSVLMTWMQNNTGGSLVPAFVCHALINLTGEVLPLHGGRAALPGLGAWTLANLLFIACVIVVLRVWGTTTMTRSPVP